MLAYHGVDDADCFDAQVQHLREQYTPVTLDDVVASLVGDVHLPPHAVLVTFDDGEPSLVRHGLPVLARRGVPAVAFVVAGLVDTDQPYWWDEVIQLAGLAGPAMVRRLKTVPDEERRRGLARLRTRSGQTIRRQQLTADDLHELERTGVRVENHSLTHPCLDRCSDGVVEHEIAESHDILTQLLGRPPTAFAYPNGNLDARAQTALAERGYRLGFAFDHRVARLPVTEPFAVARIRVDATTPLSRFRMLVSGMHPWLHHRMGRS